MYLQQRDGEFGVYFSSDPDAGGLMDAFCFKNSLQQLIHEVQAKMAVLQKDPCTLCFEPSE